MASHATWPRSSFQRLRRNIHKPRVVRFEDFRQWALDTTRQAALRWEDPEADEAQVMLGLDAYGDRHVIPVPPAYLTPDGRLSPSP